MWPTPRAAGTTHHVRRTHARSEAFIFAAIDMTPASKTSPAANVTAGPCRTKGATNGLASRHVWQTLTTSKVLFVSRTIAAFSAAATTQNFLSATRADPVTRSWATAAVAVDSTSSSTARNR